MSRHAKEVSYYAQLEAEGELVFGEKTLMIGEKEISVNKLFVSLVLVLPKAYNVRPHPTLKFLSLGICDTELKLGPNWAIWTPEQCQVN